VEVHEEEDTSKEKEKRMAGKFKIKTKEETI